MPSESPLLRRLGGGDSTVRLIRVRKNHRKRHGQFESGTRVRGCDVCALDLTPGQRFPKSSKFTDSIVLHGRWENNTLDEATNLQRRRQQSKERTTKKMEHISKKFRGEMEEVERIQEIVRIRQRRLAWANLRTCCAIMIQTSWRRHRAKGLAWARRGAILSAIIMRWWTRYKANKSVAKIRAFVLSTVRRTRRQRKAKQQVAIGLQCAWRRRVAREAAAQKAMVSAAIEAVVSGIVDQLSVVAYRHCMATVIARAWRRWRSRPYGANRKVTRGGRIFLTQGGVTSSRRKPRGNSTSVRGGQLSDPSSSPRSAGPTRGKNRDRQARTPSSPSMGTVVSVAVVVESTKEELAKSHRLSTQSTTYESIEQDRAQGDPTSGGALITQPLSASAPSSSRAGVDQNSDAKVLTGNNGAQQERKAPAARVPASSGVSGDIQKQSSKAKGVRPPYATVHHTLGNGVVGNGSEGAGGDSRGEDVLVTTDGPQKLSASFEQAEVVAGNSPLGGASTSAMQPQRPNGFKPSKLQEGRSRMFSLGRSGAKDTVNGVGGGDGVVTVGVATSVESTPSSLSVATGIRSEGVGNCSTAHSSVTKLPDSGTSADRKPSGGASSTSMMAGLSDPDRVISSASTSDVCPTTQADQTRGQRYKMSQVIRNDTAARGGGDGAIIVDDDNGTRGETGGVCAVVVGSPGGERLRQQRKNAEIEQGALIEMGSLSTRSHVEEYADEAFETDTEASPRR